jgi:hypothetical protein
MFEDLLMKLILPLIFLFIIPSAYAESYTLYFDSKCSATGQKLEFKCKSEPAEWAQNLKIFAHKGKWFGEEELSKKRFPLTKIKEDGHVMIFDYPVLYSGIATIVLIKKTKRFYFSETSYSEVLEVQDVTVEAGRFTFSQN